LVALIILASSFIGLSKSLTYLCDPHVVLSTTLAVTPYIIARSAVHRRLYNPFQPSVLADLVRPITARQPCHRRTRRETSCSPGGDVWIRRTLYQTTAFTDDITCAGCETLVHGIREKFDVFERNGRFICVSCMDQIYRRRLRYIGTSARLSMIPHAVLYAHGGRSQRDERASMFLLRRCIGLDEAIEA
jgi:hypothetical protein